MELFNTLKFEEMEMTELETIAEHHFTDELYMRLFTGEMAIGHHGKEYEVWVFNKGEIIDKKYRQSKRDVDKLMVYLSKIE